MNGVEWASNNITTFNTVGHAFEPDDGTGSTALGIGCLLNESGYFEGNIAEVALYPSALATADILAHYNAGKSAATPATGAGSYTNLVLNEIPAPYVYVRLNDTFAYPVANNYGILGASGNGFYLPGTVPNGATGPAALVSLHVGELPGQSGSARQHSFSRDKVNQTVISPMVGQTLNVGNYVAISPGTNNQWNIITNAALLPSPSTGTGSNATVMAWVQVPNQPVNWLQAVAARNDAASWRMNVVAISAPGSGSTSSNGFPDFVDGGNDDTGYLNQLNDGNWHFWTGVFNCANSNCMIYVDGALLGTLQESRPSFNQYSPLILGRYPEQQRPQFRRQRLRPRRFHQRTDRSSDSTRCMARLTAASSPAAGERELCRWQHQSRHPDLRRRRRRSATVQRHTRQRHSPGEHRRILPESTTENLVITPPLTSGDFTSYYLQVGDGVSQTANSTAMR